MMGYRVDVPEGTDGGWRVQRFTVSEKDAELERLRSAFHMGRGVCRPGTFTALYRGNTLVMSDTPDEIRDHLWAIAEARARVLVVGLGLGMVVNAMLRKPEVEHVTVVEKAPEVIRLVGPWLTAQHPGRVTILEADIFTWQPPKGARWQVAWFDIWDNMCSDNLNEMKLLHRRFGRRAEWKGSWARYECERYARSGR
jgi:hypothetical protein